MHFTVALSHAMFVSTCVVRQRTWSRVQLEMEKTVSSDWWLC